MREPLIPTKREIVEMMKLRYNPSTGELSRTDRAAKEICPWRNGYRYISIWKRSFPVHRVIWCKLTGEWPHPNLVIDHINGIKYDNRIVNLRLVTKSENGKNRHEKLLPQLLINAFEDLNIKYTISKAKNLTLISLTDTDDDGNYAEFYFDRDTGLLPRVWYKKKGENI